MNEDTRRALQCALAYRRLGYVPLPSRDAKKRPVFDAYAEYRSSPIPESVYTEDGWTARNIQLFTGAQTTGRSKLVVVDCDGERARDVWKAMCKKNGLPSRRIWISRSPSGGRHVYFSVPPGIEEVKTRVVWGLWDTWGKEGKGGWSKHQEVKILGEGVLVVAPPSIHVDYREPGLRYEFEPGYSPKDSPTLEAAPQWLLDMPSVTAPIARDVLPPRQREVRTPAGDSLDEIQDAIPAIEKVRIAEGWGLRWKAGTRHFSGWIACHAIGGDDDNASCSFHAESGRFKDHREGLHLSFFQLGVATGHFKTVGEAAKWCKYEIVRSI